MGNQQEEDILEKEIDKLEDREMEINLQLYKLQQEVNNLVPKEEQKKVKKNYEHIIDKIKNKKKPKKPKKETSEDPFEQEEFESAREAQKEWNKNKEKEKDDKTKSKKNKEHYLDSGLPKLNKRIKELEKIDKEEEINETRRNKEKIKRDYINDLNKVENDIFEEDVKDEMIRNIYNLDNPDMNEQLLNDKLSKLYNGIDDDNNNSHQDSLYEDNYSNDYELYKNIVKENKLKDKLDEVKVTFLKPDKKEGDDGNEDNLDKNNTNKNNNTKSETKYEYEVTRNKMIEKALAKRNHVVKNGYVLKDDNSPYSDYAPSEDNKSNDNQSEKSGINNKSDNLSQYY